MRSNKKVNKETPVSKNPIKSLLNMHLLFKSEEHETFLFKLLDYVCIAISLGISLFTHFYLFGEPNSVVFDEVYFGNFTNYYLKHEYFFDIHPPLGKQMLYIGAKVLGYKGDLVFGHISQPYPNKDYKLLRFWPSLAASLISPVIFITLRLNGVSLCWSLSSSLLPAFDNSMLVESRFILIDSFLWLFAALSIMFCSFTIKRPNRAKKFAILTGIFVGSTISTKFTGAGVTFGVIAAYITHFNLVKAIELLFISGFSALLVFIGSFYFHFIHLYNPGMGCRYHQPGFCEKLHNRNIFYPFLATFDTIGRMLRSNFGIQQTHSYASKWWQWPLMLGKGNWMWFVDDRNLWCVGSPVVWYYAFDGVILWLVYSLWKKGLGDSLWIMIAYLASYLPFAHVGRVMWNYHYIIPLEISIQLSAIIVSKIAPKSYVLSILLVVCAIYAYYIQMPITYGLPISQQKLKKIMFKQWTY